MREAAGDRIVAAKAREFHTLGTVLGLGYENSTIVAVEPSSPPIRDGQVYMPTARPGYLAPHAWLVDGRSLYDMFGPGFSLVVAPEADDRQVNLAVSDAEALGVPLQVVRPKNIPILDLYQAELTLVRPDQHVAWRGDLWSREALERATGNIITDVMS